MIRRVLRQVITGLVSILLDAILQSSGGGGGGSSGRLRRALGRGEEAGQGGAGRRRVPPEASCSRARARRRDYEQGCERV